MRVVTRRAVRAILLDDAGLVRPALEDGANVILDSYYVKVLAKERIFGTVYPALEPDLAGRCTSRMRRRR
jgi:hypothetical protein